MAKANAQTSKGFVGNSMETVNIPKFSEKLFSGYDFVN
jgi:hypothetical protein